MQTAEGKLYLFVGIDRTRKFAATQLVDRTDRKTAWEFLQHIRRHGAKRTLAHGYRPIWAGWASLALLIDCHTRELLGWHLSRSGKASTASAALEHGLIAKFGTLGRIQAPLLLRSDNPLVFTSRHFTALVRSYGLTQEFIMPHCPRQNGMVERVIRTLKEQCVHRRRFENIRHAVRVIRDWISFYNNHRPHQALASRTPSE